MNLFTFSGLVGLSSSEVESLWLERFVSVLSSALLWAVPELRSILHPVA